MAQPHIVTRISADAQAAQLVPARGLGIRIILIALLFAPLTAYWCVDQTLDTIFSLMVPPVVFTLVLAVANVALRRLAPRFTLTESDLIIFFAMQTVMAAICAEWMSVINPYIHSYALYKDGDTRFEKYVLPYTHPWFFVQPQDADKFQDYSNGGYPFSYF